MAAVCCAVPRAASASPVPCPPLLPRLLTCHGSEVVGVPRLQAVRRRHHPLLVDDGRAAEAQAVAVHQQNLWERGKHTQGSV